MYKCDMCNSTDTYVKNYKFEYNLKGRSISFNSDRRFCSKCNNPIYDGELDSISSKKALDEYTRKYGIHPSKIIELRKKYNLTQEEFAKIIGCAKKTLISYEKGTSIPNDIYLITIKMFIDNPELLPLLVESNKDLFTIDDYEKIIKKTSINLEKENDPTEFNGYNNFNINKVYGLISLLASNGIYKTKLLKEMFYCDFLHYKNNGVSITGLEYKKFQFGPVPNNYESILDNAYNERIIDIDVEYNSNYEAYSIKTNRKYKCDFDENELNTINYVVDYFKSYTVNKIVDFSHKEVAFIKTKDKDLIDYDYAFDLNI